MGRKFIFITLVVFFTRLSGNAQGTDFLTWWGAEVSSKLFDLVDVEVDPELRLWNNSSRFESVVTEIDASVPVTKFLEFGVLYRLQTENKKQDYLHYVNRFGAIGHIEFKVHRFKIAYRVIYQQEYKDWHTSELGYIPTIQHRHKISLKYNIKGVKLDPFLAGEMFFTLRPTWQTNREKLRLTTGIKYKLNKHTDISLEYKYQREFYRNNPSNSSIIKTTFSYDL